MQRQITPIVITLSLLLGVALWRVPLVQGWTPTGDLNVGRYSHTATLLPDGRVLVHGGRDGTSALYSTELYDPATGRWTFTGGGFYERAGHTATLLLNGRVLVAGGRYTNTNSEEYYHPPTGNWYFTSPLLTERLGHTATLLADGRVLVAGGYNGTFSPPDDSLRSAEIYDPDAFSWTPTGDLNVGRHGHTATLLPDRRVLIAGGRHRFNSLSSAEVYDPATGRWTLTSEPFYARAGHTATRLTNSRVLVAGGRRNYNSEEVYDPPTGNWYPTIPLLVQRASHAATLLPNGRVLVAGGRDPSGFDLQLNSAEVYNPVTLEWTPIAALHVARSLHTMTLLLNGHVLVAGGASGPEQSVRSAEVYDSALTCSVITVYPSSAPPATQGAAYTALFVQTGSSGITLWSLSAGTLPNGLVLNTNNGRGVLAGVPTAAGTFHFTVRATNGNCVGERAYTLVVTGMSATAAPSPLP